MIVINIKAYDLSVKQTAETGLFQSSNMNEYIFISAFRLNKSISFFGIEPLYCTFYVLFLIKKLIVITIHVALTA